MSQTVTPIALLGMMHPACVEETDVQGEKNLFLLLSVGYLTSFTISLQEVVPDGLFQ